MMRWIVMSSVLSFLLARPPCLPGQGRVNGYRADPYRPVEHTDPRLQRAQREQAVAAVGPVARDLVEMHGADGVLALFACSQPVAVRLAQFHQSGELAKLPRPRDLLRVIAQPRHGDDVALWAIDHAGELADTDSFDAYLINPLEYALGLKPLAEGAAQARARRLHQASAPTEFLSREMSSDAKLAIALGLGLLIILALVLWKRKQPRIS
jgi:hypothetical protein